jgi:hypothetical protein
MSSASPDKAAAAAAPTIAPLLFNILVAVGGAFTAWGTLSARFQRVQRFETDTAGGEKSFRLFYVVPQYINAALFIGLISIACVASIGGLMASAAPGIRIGGADTWFGRLAVTFYDLGWWVVVLGVAAGGIAVTDLVARIGLLLARVVSWIPLGRLEGCFGSEGRSLGWLQAKELVRGGGSALPLAIDRDGIDRVADAVLEYANATGLAGSYRAAPPHGSPSAKGNIALFACIIEQVENDLQKPRRDWDKLYEAFSALNQSSSLLEPGQLNAVPDGQAFYTALQTGLDPLLTAFTPAQPPLPRGIFPRNLIAAAFERLKSKYEGDVIQMAFRQPIDFGSAVYGLLVRARHFPKLERMGPQFVKLCVRFGAVDVTAKDVFVPAFSSAIGWYLLDKDALTALQEVKSLAFRGSMNRPAVRIAEMKVLKIVAGELEASIGSFPALASAAATMGPDQLRWYIEQEADTALWGTSQAALQAAGAANWANCRWKLDNLAATRV